MTTPSASPSAALAAALGALAALAGCAAEPDLVLNVRRDDAALTATVYRACRADDHSKCQESLKLFDSASGGNVRRLQLLAPGGVNQVLLQFAVSAPAQYCRQVVVDLSMTSEITLALQSSAMPIELVSCPGCVEDTCEAIP